MGDDGRCRGAVLDQTDNATGLREDFTWREPTVCRRVCRAGEAAQTELPPRQQMLPREPPCSARAITFRRLRRSIVRGSPPRGRSSAFSPGRQAVPPELCAHSSPRHRRPRCRRPGSTAARAGLWSVGIVRRVCATAARPCSFRNQPHRRDSGRGQHSSPGGPVYAATY